MKITVENKAILWSILEKYDGVKEYKNFCDAISNIIQGNDLVNSLFVIYSTLYTLDLVDKNKIDSTIGEEIGVSLF
jgi:hypothetical protein